MMMEGQGKSSGALRGSFSIGREILAESGARGLFKGYFASVLTYAPSSAIWWSTYRARAPGPAAPPPTSPCLGRRSDIS